MPRIHYLNEELKNKTKNSSFIVIFLILSFVMGLIGGVGSLVVFSSNSKVAKALGISSGTINLSTTKTEKLRLEESSSIIDSVKKVTPAVVSITTTSNSVGFFGQVFQQQGGGTGFIITSDGLILTNKHVAEAGDTLSVLTSDNKTYSAKKVAVDPTNDLAILKIDASGLPVVDLGNSDDLQIGQWVVAVGNALGELQNTVTVGVISARERQVTAGGNGSSEQLNNMLQTDAAINSGNSGGPLVNLAGQVIGINTAVASNAQGIGFAIPINQAKQAIDSYKRSGKIIKPYLGISYVMLSKDIADSQKLPLDHGAWLANSQGQSGVISDGPAAKAGLKSGDIITEIEGQAINDDNTPSKIIASYKPGDEVTVKYFRDGKESTLKIKLGSIE